MTIETVGNQAESGNAASETPPEEGKRFPWLTAFCCVIPVFMVSLDNLVVTLALPTIQHDFQATPQQLEWVVNAYVLTFASLLMFVAALGDKFGHRRFMMLCIIFFTASSALCGWAGSIEQLIGFRALQAVGGAGTVPLSLVLLANATTKRQRMPAMAVWGMASGLGIAVGPLLGGAVLEGWSWRWIFWLNVPVGLILIPAIRAAIKGNTTETDRRIDILGLILVGAGVFVLTWGIVHASEDGWGSRKVLTALSCGALFLIGFVIWQTRCQWPLLPLSLYRVRAFSLVNIASGTMYFGTFGSVYLLNQLLQAAPPRTPLQAATIMLTWTLMPVIVAPLAGLLGAKTGGGPLVALGLLLLGLGLLWLDLQLSVRTTYKDIALPLVLGGVGMGLAYPMTASVLVESLPESERGRGTGCNTTIREIGGALGIAVLTTVFLRHGSMMNPQSFLDGVKPAVLVGSIILLIGAAVALGIPRKAAHATHDG